MKLKKELILRELAGDFFLVPTGSTTLELNGMILMNDLGAEIWELIPEADTAEDIVRTLLSRYDATEEEISGDVADFLGKLQQLGII